MPSGTGEFERVICVTIIITNLNQKLLISHVSAALYVLQTQ